MSDINYEKHWLPHWAEHPDGNGGTIWKSYGKRLPEIHAASTVVRKNKDGSFEYIKSHGAKDFAIMTKQEEKEFLFIMLSAERYCDPRWDLDPWQLALEARLVEIGLKVVED